jgi:hypothetical protein
MNRRSFITGIISASVAPMFLPGVGRLWRATVHVPHEFGFRERDYAGDWEWTPIGYGFWMRLGDGAIWLDISTQPDVMADMVVRPLY